MSVLNCGKLKISLFGESHGKYVGSTIFNIKHGIKIDYDYINKELSHRRPYDVISTNRVEDDEFEFVSGVYNGFTTGMPLTVLIKNKNVDSSIYEEIKGIARPSHADYTSHIKYKGYEDYRGGGYFSGRLTAPLVLIGSILKKELEKNNIYIATHILNLADIIDDDIDLSIDQIKKLNNKQFPVINDNVKEKMINKIKEVAKEKDSISSILETCIVGINCGIGGPYFDSLESKISYAIFSIPGVKGLIFGNADKCNNMLGSMFNDEFYYEGNIIKTKTNNNAGINGGISNGMPIIFKTYVKPTPSILKTQKTVDYINKTNVSLNLKGRFDPCISHRIRPVIDNLLAIVLYGEIYG